jgi:excisionase family DNA binding protein
MNDDTTRLLTVRQAALRLQQSEQTVRRKLTLGELSGIRLGDHNRRPWRTAESSLDEYLTKGSRRA